RCSGLPCCPGLACRAAVDRDPIGLAAAFRAKAVLAGGLRAGAARARAFRRRPSRPPRPAAAWRPLGAGPLELGPETRAVGPRGAEDRDRAKGQHHSNSTWDAAWAPAVRCASSRSAPEGPAPASAAEA